MSILLDKLKDNLYAVVPITLIVFLLHFTLVPLDSDLLIRFFLGAVLVIFGLSLFLIGVDIGITPLGGLVGTTLVKTNRLWIVVLGGLILGFFTSVAEPGLMVLANQVDMVTAGQISSATLLIVVSIGLAVMVAFGFVRILYNIPLYLILTVAYSVVFLFAIFTPPEFLGIAFDASGATTGILAVPFILSLSVGLSALKKDSKASEKDSFGLVAIASVGAIISVMLLSVLSTPHEFGTSLDITTTEAGSVMQSFPVVLSGILKEALMALLPLLITLSALQTLSFRLDKRAYTRMLKGFAYAFLGLVMFFVGVNSGFMDVGSELGYHLASLENKAYVIITGFILGIVTILAEPAVYVLTHQIEDVTSGYVKRKAVSMALSLGVGIAVALSIVRVLVPGIQLWHYLVPGYIIAIALMYFVPKLFVGIAFDAGGVATGPMTATFVLAFTTGAADAFEGANVLVDGFGMIALVAMTPIITLQILGYIFETRSKKEGVEEIGQ